MTAHPVEPVGRGAAAPVALAEDGGQFVGDGSRPSAALVAWGNAVQDVIRCVS